MQIAQKLHSWGWSVVPVPNRTKFPIIAWRTFQQRQPTPEELGQWFQNDPGLAVVCGEVSGNLVCLDFDELDAYGLWEVRHPHLALRLPTAMRSRGIHVTVLDRAARDKLFSD